MPNFATVLKGEIARIARKEVRAEIEELKKASVYYRSQIAALKRQVQALEKQVGRLARAGAKAAAVAPAKRAATSLRFSAKRLAVQRQKLGLSAAAFGTLIGVSGQTIYLWESGKTRPRASQLQSIAAARGLGKREAAAKLAELAPA